MPSSRSSPGARLLAVDPIEGTMIREVNSLRPGPAAERIDAEEQRDVLKLTCEPGGYRCIPRAIKMLCRNLLSLRGIKIPQIFLGHRARAVLIDVLIDDADRRFRDDAD